MFVKQDGTHWGHPMEWVCKKNEETGLAEFVVKFQLTHLFRAGWVALPEAQEITAYFQFFKKDGSRNDFVVEMIAKVFKWDMASLDALNNTDFKALDCQVVVRDNEWKGKTFRKVAFVNPSDYQPTPLNAKVAETSLDAEFGAGLKAGGRVPVAAPKAGPPVGSAGRNPPPAQGGEPMLDENGVPF